MKRRKITGFIGGQIGSKFLDNATTVVFNLKIGMNRQNLVKYVMKYVFCPCVFGLLICKGFIN